MKDVIFFKNQEDFICWLEEHDEATELWVGYYRKSSGRSSLTWSTSVDVALCFGWIDGIRKSIDEESFKIRFTPRKKHSVWSAVNVNKVKTLIELGKMKPKGIKLFNNRSSEHGYTSEHRNIPLPKEYEEQIKTNQQAWLFFTNLAPSYKRDSIWWVMTAKKEETRLRRLSILMHQYLNFSKNLNLSSEKYFFS